MISKQYKHNLVIDLRFKATMKREFSIGKRFSSKELGFRGMFKMLVMTVTLMVCGVVEGELLSKQKILEVERKMNSLRKQAIKSIKSEDGDIIDCINIHQQPAFDHPALRHHTIQMAPSYDPTMEEQSKMETAKRKGMMEDDSMVVKQTWRKSGSCPKGTIPMRRIRKKHLLKADPVELYGRKKPKFSLKIAQPSNNQSSNLRLINHSKAYLHTEGLNYNAAKGDIKVCNPLVEADDEYSTSQVALINGPYDEYELVESGWAVNPSVYGDRQTRIFTYWTTDASKTTGCFDLTCPGFVQVNNEIALGSAIYPISTPNELPYQVTIFLYRDLQTSNLWMQYNGDHNVGYWPATLFNALSHTAEVVEWGGEVYSTRVGEHPHTATAMGNGHFPDYISGNSGWIKGMRIRDNSMILKFPGWINYHSDEYDCYDIDFIRDYLEDPELYYGGPGQNPKCP